MNKHYLLIVFLFCFLNCSFAQTFEEFKKNENEQFEKFSLQQEKGLAELANEFDNYIRQADKEFMDFLKKEWEEYSAFKGVEIPERPKPVDIPELRPYNEISLLTAKELSVSLPSTEPLIIADKPLLPIIQKTESEDYLKTAFGIEYYGTHLSFECDDELSRLGIQSINEQEISKWWAECSNTNYNQMVNQLISTKNKLSLNDWAYFQLVNKTSEALANGDANKARLLEWFLMLRSAYKVKVAFTDNTIFILFPSANELYGKSFLIINNERYYFKDDISSNTFQTYDFDFPGSNRLIDFNIYQPLNIGDDVLDKQIKFSHLDKDYSFPVSVSINTLYLLKDYPVTELSVFFNAAMSRLTKQTLAKGLMPHISAMNTNEALNFLLAFVQKSFQYKTDQEQFKKEKFFFPEELFYYAASDCEDRSALFAYLVKQLLHLEVIGLEYPGHVATAVHTTDDTQGDYLFYNNTKYIIADPTYVNAPLGLAMIQYKNKEAKVIETNNTNYILSLTDDYWKLTNQWGGFRGSNLCDAKYDSYGNCYLTGYYTNNLSFGDYNWVSEAGNRQAFIVKYNKEKEVQWARNIVTDGIATAFALAIDNSDNPVIAGSFNGEINAEGKRLSTKKTHEDIFIAAYTSEGDLMWLKKTGLDTVNYGQFMNYVVKFNHKGEYLNTKLYFENASGISKGIFFDNNSFTLIGGINSTTGFNISHPSFDAEKDFNTSTYLKSENDLLIQNNVDTSIAGFLAVINLLKISGMVIPGEEAQKALDEYNPGFRISSDEIYESIGSITFMKNEEGIVSLKTNNGKSVFIHKMKISDNAKIKITSLQNGNEQIDILQGMKVGKAFIWFDLNFVRTIKDTGDLLFDYDSDHTQRTVNMKKDILEL